MSHHRRPSKDAKSGAGSQQQQSGAQQVPRRVSSTRDALSRTNSRTQSARSSRSPSISRSGSSSGLVVQLNSVSMRLPKLINSTPPTLKPIVRQHKYQKLVFLAGGMGGDIDWRANVAAYLKTAPGAYPDVVLMNPYFHAETDDMQRQLMKWETAHFAKSHLDVYWFHRYSKCIVSLVEFGAWARLHGEKPENYRVIVGADPEYEFRGELVERCEGKYTLHNSLKSLMKATAVALQAL